MSSCRKYQEEIIDALYDERDFDEELQEHLKKCPECSQYYQEIKATRQELDLMSGDPPLDMTSIQNAFREADNRADERKKKYDVFIFGLVIILFVLVSVLIFNHIGSKYFVYFQLYLYMGFPLFVVPFMALKKRKEGERDG